MIGKLAEYWASWSTYQQGSTALTVGAISNFLAYAEVRERQDRDLTARNPPNKPSTEGAAPSLVVKVKLRSMDDYPGLEETRLTFYGDDEVKPFTFFMPSKVAQSYTIGKRYNLCLSNAS